MVRSDTRNRRPGRAAAVLAARRVRLARPTVSWVGARTGVDRCAVHRGPRRRLDRARSPVPALFHVCHRRAVRIQPHDLAHVRPRPAERVRPGGGARRRGARRRTVLLRVGGTAGVALVLECPHRVHADGPVRGAHVDHAVLQHVQPARQRRAQGGVARLRAVHAVPARRHLRHRRVAAVSEVQRVLYRVWPPQARRVVRHAGGEADDPRAGRRRRPTRWDTTSTGMS